MIPDWKTFCTASPKLYAKVHFLHPEACPIHRPHGRRRAQGQFCPHASKRGVDGTKAKQSDILGSEQESSKDEAGTPTNSNGSAPRQAVVEACLKTSLFMTIAGLGLRSAAYQISDKVQVFDSSRALALLTNDLEWWHSVLALLLVAGITGGRLILLNLWPSYKSASDKSNQMVLPSLDGQDLLLISFLPGFSEELLFRGALVPALGGTEIAVIAAASAFGVLHVGGGRNAAFAIWAIFVGLIYGGAYLYTHDLFVPAFAHSLANYASASLWLSSRSQQTH